jgi:hypothetical protein
MPKGSEEYQYYIRLCGYEKLGEMFLLDNSNEAIRAMITHLKKARAIYNLVGLKDSAQRIDTIISKKQAINDGEAPCIVDNSFLQEARNTYERIINDFGMNSDETLQLGLHYAKMLWVVNHCIEAERIAIKVANTSRQVH